MCSRVMQLITKLTLKSHISSEDSVMDSTAERIVAVCLCIEKDWKNQAQATDISKGCRLTLRIENSRLSPRREPMASEKERHAYCCHLRSRYGLETIVECEMRMCVECVECGYEQSLMSHDKIADNVALNRKYAPV